MKTIRFTGSGPLIVPPEMEKYPSLKIPKSISIETVTKYPMKDSDLVKEYHQKIYQALNIHIIGYTYSASQVNAFKHEILDWCYLGKFRSFDILVVADGTKNTQEMIDKREFAAEIELNYKSYYYRDSINSFLTKIALTA